MLIEDTSHMRMNLCINNVWLVIVSCVSYLSGFLTQSCSILVGFPSVSWGIFLACYVSQFVSILSV